MDTNRPAYKPDFSALGKRSGEIRRARGLRARQLAREAKALTMKGYRVELVVVTSNDRNTSDT